MAGYKETPRQKMIAMMYLVLTALLALNVSREILSAFLVVNESMETTNKQFSAKVDEIYSAFEKQYSINPNKVEEYWNKAKDVRVLSNDLVKYIDGLKATVISLTEDIPLEAADTIRLLYVNKKDNYDTPTNFFIGTDIKKGEAEVLLARITEYKQNLLKMISEKDREGFELGLKTDGEYKNRDGKEESWAYHHFYRTILAADITILNKLITEVYNAETNVVNYLYSSISAEDFKFDEVNAKVIPNSNYVFQGDKYRAEILVAAYDTKQDPEVYVLEGADTLTEAAFSRATRIAGSDGIVKLELPASSEGTKKYAGFIRLKTPWGTAKDYHFHHEYIVAKPSATVSATKMNVFYRGVDNPVSISASGKADAQLHPDITSGNIVRTDTGWVVRDLPADAFEVTVKINAEDNGSKKFMGSHKFRIRPLPDPIARVLSAKEGKATIQELLTNPFLICALPSYVEFKYDFKVTSFTMMIPKGGGELSTDVSENQMFTESMKNMIKSLKKNDAILFQNIKVKGPEGPRTIQSISITIN
jgi:gliding motility-associated protein GldM